MFATCWLIFILWFGLSRTPAGFLLNYLVVGGGGAGGCNEYGLSSDDFFSAGGGGAGGLLEGSVNIVPDGTNKYTIQVGQGGAE